MWRAQRNSLAKFVLMTVFLVVAFSKTADAQIQQNVLILNSYHKGFTWSDDQTQGMIQTVHNLGMDPIFHVEYMDWKFNPTQENLRLRHEQFKLRYASRHIDLVMTTDDAALVFALKHRKELFSNAPVVFSGILQISPSLPGTEEHDLTGVYERFDSEGTIRLMKRLNPDLRRIYLAYDNTESGLQTAALMKSAADKVDPSLELIHLNTHTFTNIVKLLASLPEGDNSAVLINTYSRDVEGNTMEMERYVKIFSGNSRVPTFILYDFDNGYGGVGGSLIGGFQQGEAAAKIAVRILKGEKASTIPPVEGTEPKVIVDYRQLQTFKIPLDRLPSNAVIINRTPSFFEQYKAAVLTTVGVFFLMVVFIVALMINIRRRVAAEEELMNNNLELTALNEQIQASQLELQHQYEELEEIQEALRDSEEKYRSLVNNVSVGVFRSPPGPGQFIQANPAMAQIFGYDSVEEFTQIPIINIYQNPEDRKLLIDEVEYNGFVKNKEIAFRKKDGAPICCSITSNGQYDGSGNIKWLDGVVEDITDRKRAEEALRHAHEQLEIKVEERTRELFAANQELTAVNEQHTAMNEELTAMNEELIHNNEELQKEIAERHRVEKELNKAIDNLKTMQGYLIQSEKMAALGSLVAGVTHEINTPVGVSVTASSYLKQITEQFTELCKQGAPIRQDLIEYLDNLQEASTIILRNLERAGKLIRSFKQISVDQSSETQRVFNVKKYSEEILLSMNPIIKKTKHHISVECDEDLNINGFPGAFAQVVTNLVMNSLIHAYGPEDEGKIRIAILKDERCIVFSYSDDGKGMEKNVLAKIFDPFFTTKRGSGGTGLGLSVVYNIVTQQFGGTIECDSAPGKGTNFRITMPIPPEKFFPEEDKVH